MHDIGIVPNAIGRQVIALEVSDSQVIFIAVVGRGIGSYFQSVDAVVEEAISSEQRSTVPIDRLIAIHVSSLATEVSSQLCIHRVCIDGDGRPIVVLEHVIQKDRLGTACKDRRASAVVVAERIVLIRRSTQAVDGALASHPVAIVFKDRVCEPRRGLLQLDRAEGFEGTFEPRDATGVSDDRVIKTQVCTW